MFINHIKKSYIITLLPDMLVFYVSGIVMYGGVLKCVTSSLKPKHRSTITGRNKSQREKNAFIILALSLVIRWKEGFCHSRTVE